MSPYEYPREHYRIPYPVAARPILLVDDEEYPVIDIAEMGIRYDCGAHPRPAIGAVVRGTMHFKRSAEALIRGHVIRIQDRQVAVRLDVAIPFKLILDEQRYLRDSHRGMAW